MITWKNVIKVSSFILCLMAGYLFGDVILRIYNALINENTVVGAKIFLAIIYTLCGLVLRAYYLSLNTNEINYKELVLDLIQLNTIDGVCSLEEYDSEDKTCQICPGVSLCKRFTTTLEKIKCVS